MWPPNATDFASGQHNQLSDVCGFPTPPKIVFMTKLTISADALRNIISHRSAAISSTVVAATLVAAILAVSHSPAYAVTPECSSAFSDSDGDGWGWENNRSCLVTTSPPPSQPQTATISASGPPVCESASSDPDGDGYGWERSATCIIGTTSQSIVSSQPDTTPGVANAGTSAALVCASADSDPDGDGYGWENNRSCLVTAASTTQPGNQAAQPSSGALRFMAVGDSITCLLYTSDAADE